MLRADLSDPMSGYFAIRRTTFDRAVRRRSVRGYKILNTPFIDDWVYAWPVERLLNGGALRLLDYCCCGRWNVVTSVPYTRWAGRSGRVYVRERPQARSRYSPASPSSRASTISAPKYSAAISRAARACVS